MSYKRAYDEEHSTDEESLFTYASSSKRHQARVTELEDEATDEYAEDEDVLDEDAFDDLGHVDEEGLDALMTTSDDDELEDVEEFGPAPHVLSRRSHTMSVPRTQTPDVGLTAMIEQQYQPQKGVRFSGSGTSSSGKTTKNASEATDLSELERGRISIKRQLAFIDRRLASSESAGVEQPMKNPGSSVQKVAQTPSTDAESDLKDAAVHQQICREYDHLKKTTQDLSLMFPKFDAANLVNDLMNDDNIHLIRHVGCLAMGAKTGRAGWMELFAKLTSRQALVMAVIGQVLKEHVFGESYFGASDTLKQQLDELEKKEASSDGFRRTKARAKVLDQVRSDKLSDEAYQTASAKVTMQLEEMLKPLWRDTSPSGSWDSNSVREKIANIVRRAGELNHRMREDANTIYYFPPTFKDEEFDPDRMECYNLQHMLANTPYDNNKTDNGQTRATIRPGREHDREAIVRIVTFPGLVTYQQGGGDLAARTLAHEAKRNHAAPSDVRAARAGRTPQRHNGPDPDDPKSGFRTKTLARGLVVLEWGRQRLLTKEAGTSAHLRAKAAGDTSKYDEDYAGFEELWDIFARETGWRAPATPGPTLAGRPPRSSASKLASVSSGAGLDEHAVSRRWNLAYPDGPEYWAHKTQLTRRRGPLSELEDEQYLVLQTRLLRLMGVRIERRQGS